MMAKGQAAVIYSHPAVDGVVCEMPGCHTRATGRYKPLDEGADKTFRYTDGCCEGHAQGSRATWLEVEYRSRARAERRYRNG